LSTGTCLRSYNIYGEFEGIIAIISTEYIFIKCLISEDHSLGNTAYDTCS